MSSKQESGALAESRSDRWAADHAGGANGLAGSKPRRGRLLRSRSLGFLIAVSVAMTLVPVIWILVETIMRGGSAMSWEFLSQSQIFSMVREGGGFLNGLIGTAIMVALASAIAIPLGILAAVYLVEYGKANWLAKLIRFFSDVMTGVPSIFVGVFIYVALIKDSGALGYGALAGAAALTLIMMPIVVRSSEEMLKLVPGELKDASYALGAPKWQTITRVVLPSAAPGLTTGAMLAVARAAGETAPLIMAAFGSLQLVTALNKPISSLTLLIYQQAGQPFPAAQARAWAGALELMAIVFILTIVARIMSSRSRVSR